MVEHSPSPDAMRWTPEPDTSAPDHERAVTEAAQARSVALDRSGVTRAGLIQDGHLIEPPADMAADARWAIPIALTRAAWLDMVEWPGTEPHPQDENGRWWDVLWSAASVALRSSGGSTRHVELYRVPRGGDQETLAELVMTIGPGDDGGAAVTLALPQEG